MELLVLGLLFLAVEAKGQLLNFGEHRDSFLGEETTRPCRVPTGKSGFCVKQNQCPYISDLIKNLKKPLPGDVALLIRDSFFCPKVSYKLFILKTILGTNPIHSAFFEIKVNFSKKSCKKKKKTHASNRNFSREWCQYKLSIILLKRFGVVLRLKYFFQDSSKNSPLFFEGV